MGLLYTLQKHVFRFIGDIKWSGIKRPFWFTVNATSYRLKGQHYYQVKEVIQPGDILIRRFEGYIDKWFIPGFWNHAGLYIGEDEGKPEQIVHAISEGVIQEYLADFMRTDHMAVLRPIVENQAQFASKAVERAKNIRGKPYDFGFDFTNADRFSCTELTAYCCPDIVKGKKRFGKHTIIADDFYNSEHLTKIWDSTQTNDTVQAMGVVKAYLSSSETT